MKTKKIQMNLNLKVTFLMTINNNKILNSLIITRTNPINKNHKTINNKKYNLAAYSIIKRFKKI